MCVGTGGYYSFVRSASQSSIPPKVEDEVLYSLIGPFSAHLHVNESDLSGHNIYSQSQPSS